MNAGCAGKTVRSLGLRGVFTTRRYTNPYLYLRSSMAQNAMDFGLCEIFFRVTKSNVRQKLEFDSAKY